MTQPEPWLRGTHRELPAVLRAVVHALELAREDVNAACAPLSEEALYARPAGVAPIAFHLRHIVRSLDRLLTYAEGEQLSAPQLDALRAELDPGTPKSELLVEFHAGIDDAMRRVRAFAGADLEQARGVGRKALPTSVGGLLVHCADHTQRHAGQVVTTAKLVAGEPSASKF
ncbi:MAG: DinB family protein [Acidobacteriaceae bacterium]